MARRKMCRIEGKEEAMAKLVQSHQYGREVPGARSDPPAASFNPRLKLLHPFRRRALMTCGLALWLLASVSCGPEAITVRSVSPRLDNSLVGVGASPLGRVISLALHPDGQRAYAGTPLAGVWRSDDGGNGWRQMTVPQPPGDTRGDCPEGTACTVPAPLVGAIAVSPRNPDLVFAAIDYDNRARSVGGQLGPRDGLYRSSDGGETWQQVFACTPAQTIGQVVFTPDAPNLLWVGSGCGLHWS